MRISCGEFCSLLSSLNMSSEALGIEQNSHLSVQTFRKMASFQQSGKYCDIDVRVGSRCFSCVRAVLAAASPVLDVLFSGGMKESGEMEVNIEHIEGVPAEEIADTFKLLVDFIYCSDQFQISPENCVNLMFAGNYFQVLNA